MTVRNEGLASALTGKGRKGVSACHAGDPRVERTVGVSMVLPNGSMTIASIATGRNFALHRRARADRAGSGDGDFASAVPATTAGLSLSTNWWIPPMPFQRRPDQNLNRAGQGGFPNDRPTTWHIVTDAAKP